jgi:hypothetical protein
MYKVDGTSARCDVAGLVSRRVGPPVNVGLPMASVMPTVDGPVCAALAGTTAPQTATQDQRIARCSLEGVRLVLRRTVQAGEVLEVPGGYVLNSEHLAALAIRHLADRYGSSLVFGRLTQRAGRDGEVELVCMFGSAARRDGDEDSDSDVVVVGVPNLDEFTTDLAAAIRRRTGNGAQVIGLSSQILLKCSKRQNT